MCRDCVGTRCDMLDSKRTGDLYKGLKAAAELSSSRIEHTEAAEHWGCGLPREMCKWTKC